MLTEINLSLIYLIWIVRNHVLCWCKCQQKGLISRFDCFLNLTSRDALACLRELVCFLWTVQCLMNHFNVLFWRKAEQFKRATHWFTSNGLGLCVQSFALIYFLHNCNNKDSISVMTPRNSRAFAEMPWGLSDSVPLHLSVGFANDPAHFGLVAAAAAR